MFISSLREASGARRLRQLPGDGLEGYRHDEGWLQTLIADCPELLPITEIEPGFSVPVAVCRELPTGVGPADNLFVTPDGNLVLVECKLWRNPQARREVVAQILDYARAMVDWSYEDLEANARKANPALASLYDLVADAGELDEPAFVDAVSRNLKLGRFLLLIAGDGIREDTEALTEALQGHAGFHFTLALVEMPVFELPKSGFIVAPRIIARTVNIDRGIVKLEDGRMTVQSPPAAHGSATSSTARRSISLEQGLEEIEQADPEAFRIFRSLYPEFDARDIFLEASGASVSLRWMGPREQKHSILNIHTSTALNTRPINWAPNGYGRVDLGHAYLSDIARIIGGKLRISEKNPAESSVRSSQGGEIMLGDLMAHAAEWLEAVDRYIASIEAARGALYEE